MTPLYSIRTIFCVVAGIERNWSSRSKHRFDRGPNDLAAQAIRLLAQWMHRDEPLQKVAKEMGV